jgi:hypothetical protein
MAAFRHTSRLEATKSFVKLMSDMAEQVSRQVTDAFEPVSVRQFQPIPVKSASFSLGLPNRRRDSLKRMFA